MSSRKTEYLTNTPSLLITITIIIIIKENQVSISGPYLFNIFLNELNITLGNHAMLFKYTNYFFWKEGDCSGQLGQLMSQFFSLDRNK